MVGSAGDEVGRRDVKIGEEDTLGDVEVVFEDGVQ